MPSRPYSALFLQPHRAFAGLRQVAAHGVAVCAFTFGCGAEGDQPVVGTADAAVGPGQDGQLVVGQPGGAGAGSWLACGDVAKATCAALQRCDPHWLQIDFGTVAACEPRVQQACATQAGAADAGGLALPLQACLQQLGADCRALRPGHLPTCALLPGVRAQGAVCALDAQCQSLNCKATSGSAPGCGVCQQLPTPAACASASCPPALSTVGADCKAAPCAHSLGLQCNKETRRCEEIPMLAAGATCDMTTIATGKLQECHDGACMNQNDMGRGTCMAYAADGATCGWWTGPACRWPARCVASTCTQTPAACTE